MAFHDDPTNGDDSGDSSSMFADRQGFFRATDEQGSPAGSFPPPEFVIDAGPTWTPAEANSAALDFFRQLAGERKVVPHANAFDFVIANELLLLLSDEHQVAFEQHYRRMDDETIVQWQELLDGGTASEAFGPLSLQEQLDETQLVNEIQGRRRNRIGAIVAAVVAGGLLVVGAGALLASNDDPQTDLTFTFEDPTQAGSGGATGTPRPTISAAVVGLIERKVVVRTGVGPAADRVEPAPADSLFSAAFDELAFVLLAEDGQGRVAIVGSDGWYDELCVVVSAVSDQLRPLDTNHFGATTSACGVNPVGAAVDAVCTGPGVLMLPLTIAAGPVALDEGGEATVDSIRARVLEVTNDFEQISLRGTIDLSVEGSAIIPAFAFSSTNTVELEIPVTATTTVVTTCTAEPG